MEYTNYQVKRLCIEMWKLIADNIEDNKWREKANEMHSWNISFAQAKGQALWEMGFGEESTCENHLPRPESDCFLCERFNKYEVSCHLCPLGGRSLSGTGTSPCCRSGEPYDVFMTSVTKRDYRGAKAAALDLIRKVQEWNCDE